MEDFFERIFWEDFFGRNFFEFEILLDLLEFFGNFQSSESAVCLHC